MPNDTEHPGFPTLASLNFNKQLRIKKANFTLSPYNKTGCKSMTYSLFLAERQVLETIIKYIIIMMLHFVLYILIYSILSSI